MKSPRRLEVDERRRQLLEIGADLFARHAYHELSMADIARAAGISKPLLYHYFPSKQAFLRAALEQVAGDLRELTDTDPSKPPLEQLADALDAFLEWVEQHELAYTKLLHSADGVPEVSELIDAIREPTADRILEGLTPPGTKSESTRSRPRLAVVHGRRDHGLARARRLHPPRPTRATPRNARRRARRRHGA